jgi:hypothetical protein
MVPGTELDISVRSSPSFEAAIVGTVSGGDRVTTYDTVTDPQGNPWAYIEAGELAGWLAGGVTTVAQERQQQTVLQSPTEVLAAPHPDASVLGALPANSPVMVLDQRRDYAHIESGIVRGWIPACQITGSCN